MKEQVKELKFTPEDILIKRDMDFINRVKLPMLYKAIVECWEDLDREEKSRIIMNYIDVVNDMYDDNVLNDEDIEELDLSKEKDDFER